MDWIRAHYERAVLIAAAAFMLLCAILIWRNVVTFDQNFTALQNAPPLRNASPPGKATEVDAAAEKLIHPPQWTFSGRSGLFVPEKHFIAANGLPATLQTTEVHPPVPNEWLEQFGLPIAEADVLTQDPDGDGFTNLEEWERRTNPTDKASHPPFIAKLKMKSFSTEPFRLVFSSRTEDTFGINAIDYKQPTQFLKVGDTVTGTRFKIVKFDEKIETNQYGTEVDVSELLLKHEETGAQLTLIKEKIATSPESVATFVYAWGGERKEFAVKKDQEFTLKPEEQIKYKLVDVQPTKAVIVSSQKPNEPIEIGLVSP